MSGFAVTPRADFFLPPTTDWTPAATAYALRQLDAAGGETVTVRERAGALYFIEACYAISLKSLPFDPIYLGA